MRSSHFAHCGPFGLALLVMGCGPLPSPDGSAAQGSGGAAPESTGAGGAPGTPAEASGGSTTVLTGGAPSSGGAASGGAGSGGDTLGPSQNSLWYYFQTAEEAALKNLRADAPHVPILSGVYPDEGLFPWSPDGTLYAEVYAGEVVFYELGQTMVELARYPAQGYTAVYAWIPGFGPILKQGDSPITKLGAMKTDGTLEFLAEGTDEVPLRPSGIAPDGSSVFWGLGVLETGYELWRRSFAGGVAGEVSIIAEHIGSPPLGVAWSSEGSWMSYGLSAWEGSDDGGIYLWREGMATSENVSLDGSNYNPYFGFSADDALFVMQASGDVGLGLASLSLAGDVIGPTHHIVSGEEVSPAAWSQHGSFIAYQDGAPGFLREIQSDGMAKEPIPFPGYAYGCQLLWFSGSEFVANGCSGSDALTFGSVTDQLLSTTEHAGLASPNLALSPNDACVMGWDETTIYVGAAQAAFQPDDVPTGGGALTWVEFAPDATSIVWTEDLTTQYRIELADCLPVGAPIEIVPATSAVSVATFVSKDSK